MLSPVKDVLISNEISNCSKQKNRQSFFCHFLNSSFLINLKKLSTLNLYGFRRILDNLREENYFYEKCPLLCALINVSGSAKSLTISPFTYFVFSIPST